MTEALIAIAVVMAVVSLWIGVGVLKEISRKLPEPPRPRSRSHARRACSGCGGSGQWHNGSLGVSQCLDCGGSGLE